MSKRDLSNVARVERFFKEHPGKTHRLGNIASACGLNPRQARDAIYYLNAKAKAGNGVEIRTVERGVRWAYVPEPPKPVVRKLSPAEKEERERSGNTGAQAARERNRRARRAGAGASPESQAAVDKLNQLVGLGTAQFNRMIEALGDDERQALRERTIGAGVGTVEHPVPKSEPAVSFSVQGTLAETGELVLKGASAGVDGVWLARRLY